MRKVTVLLILIFAVLSSACLATQSPFSCSAPERIPINNLNFLSLWSRSGIAIYPDPFNSLMQGITSRVFIIISQDSQYGSSKILAFDTQSGNVLWQRHVIQPANIITSNSQLYTTLYNKIDVIDPQTGDLVKETTVSNAGTIYNIFATEHSLYADTKSGRWLTYNFGDGTYTLSEPFLPYHPFLIENGVMYFVDAEAYKAKDIKTQSNLWENSVIDAFTAHPLFTDDKIILLTKMGSIYGLDKESGKLLWKLDEHVIGNVVADRSYLYFLTTDGYLKVLDLDNGEEIMKLGFTPASFELDIPSSNNAIGAYDLWVDSQNEILTLSFGDSCQLMALKLNFP